MICRKIELYSMDFPDDINLQQMKIYASSFGGAFALMKDPNLLRKTGSTVKPVIYIFSSSGNLITKINVCNLLIISLPSFISLFMTLLIFSGILEFC